MRNKRKNIFTQDREHSTIRKKMRGEQDKMLNQKGRTIIELITGIAVGALLLTGVFQMYTGFIKSNVAVKNESELQEDLARANQVLEKDIRMTGYNVPGNGLVVDLSVENAHILTVLINEVNLSTTLPVAAASGETKFLIAEDKGVAVEQWVCLDDGDDIVYYQIAHVGVNASDVDTITIYGVLSDTWTAEDTKVIFAVGFKYSLETSGSTTSLVRRTHDDFYAISDEISGITVIPKDENGDPLTSDFNDARSISVVLTSQIPRINEGTKTVTNTVEAAIRNPS